MQDFQSEPADILSTKAQDLSVGGGESEKSEQKNKNSDLSCETELPLDISESICEIEPLFGQTILQKISIDKHINDSSDFESVEDANCDKESDFSDPTPSFDCTLDKSKHSDVDILKEAGYTNSS